MGSRAKAYQQKIAELGIDASAVEKVTHWFELAKQEGYDGHDSMLPKILTLESVSVQPTPSNPHHCVTVFSMIVPRELCNMTGNLHGGAVALIFDICTSTTVGAVAREGFWDTGHVSRTLNCTYLRPAAEGSKIYVESELVHLGKRMGLMKGVIRNEEGKVCYTCEHGKAAVGGPGL